MHIMIDDLYMAIEMGNSDRVIRLIEKGVDVDQKSSSNPNYLCPLLYAIHMNQADIVDILLGAGANLKVRNRSARFGINVNAITLCAFTYNAKSTEQIVRSLIKHGFPLNKADANDLTPIVRAVMGGELEMVKLLVELGAKIKLGDDNYGDALFAAKANGFKEIIVYLENLSLIDTAKNIPSEPNDTSISAPKRNRI